MMTTKREFLPLYAFYDRTGIAAHLEQMAAKGWLLEKMGAWCWRYRSIEPQNLRFSVTYFPKATPYTPAPAAGQETFWEFCAEAGWTLAAESAQVQVFYNAQEDPVPIETDPEVEFRTVDLTMRKAFINPYRLLLLLSAAQLGFQFWQVWQEPIEILSSLSSLCAALGYLPLMLLTATELIRCSLWRRRAKTAVEAGLPVPDLKSSRAMSRFILILSALELAGMLIGSLQTSRAMLVSLVFMLGFMILIIVLSNLARSALKRLRVSARVNKAVSIGMVPVLFCVMMGGMTALIFKADEIPFLRDPSITEQYEYYGMTWSVYGDELPLTVQDLIQTDYDQWSTRLTRDASPLMTRLRASQQPRMDALGQPDLDYEVILVRQGVLYDLSRRHFFNQVERHNDDRPEEYWDVYQPVDAAPWGAAEAYQRMSGGTPINQFLICWEDRMAELRFDWDWVITPRMMTAVCDTLNRI